MREKGNGALISVSLPDPSWILRSRSSFEVSSLQPQPSIHPWRQRLFAQRLSNRRAILSCPCLSLPLVIMPELPFALAYQQCAQLANNNDNNNNNNSKHPWSALRILFIVAKAQSLSRTRVCLHKDMSAISFICTRSKAAMNLCLCLPFLPFLPSLPSRTRQATACPAPTYP